MKKTWLIVIGVIAIIAIWLVSGYNGLVTMNEKVNGQWSQVETQLQRRSDLVPNLVNTVKGYASHEQESIKAVADARAKLGGAKTVEDKAAANDQLTGAISRLLMVSENYPNLKADQNFRALQDELAGTENRIAVARKDYNESVQTYNTKIHSFPTAMYAGMFGFHEHMYFKASEGAQAVPTVKF